MVSSSPGNVLKHKLDEASLARLKKIFSADTAECFAPEAGSVWHG